MQISRLTLSLLLCALVAACGNAASPVASSTPITLKVFAAASLQESFTDIGHEFETANPGYRVVFNFAGSQQLAQQLGQGAPADVFASANQSQMNVVILSGQVVTGTSRSFASNRLTVVLPKDNPAKLSALQDLSHPGLRIVLAAKEVPAGQYAIDFLDKAGQDAAYGQGFKAAVLGNVMSYEDNVRSVLNKVMLGEADAGIVYTTDVGKDAVAKVSRIEIPDALNTIATYPIAAIQDSTHREEAQKFVDYVLGDGQRVLAAYGFLSPAAK